jgi:hypothetical protein
MQMIRAADAKEVGVEDPAEETFCHPNQSLKEHFVGHISATLDGFKMQSKAGTRHPYGYVIQRARVRISWKEPLFEERS